MDRVRVIAEIGVNHNGSLELALQMIAAAVDAGADVVKLQTFSAEALTTRSAQKASYQVDRTGDGSQQDMLRSLQLSLEDHVRLMDECEARGVDFLSSPFDVASVDALIRLGVAEIKIASGEITNLPLLRRVGAVGLPVLLSTGMSTMDEVEAALAALAASALDRSLITLLHCTSEYPAPPEDVNLRAMVSMRERFGLPVGYSDHTDGTTIAVAAVALGARVIEKHFTLDRTMEGPDHAASLEPDRFAAMVRGIRVVERALGDGNKGPTAGELKTMRVARKSIVAARDIAAGEIFNEDNLTTKRPGTGLSPMMWDGVIGTVATRNYGADELIEL
jgi:N-acetylneuraminate synthase